MDTKLTIAFLSGLSLFMSVGAFAVSDDLSSDEINWSYVMGDTKPMKTAKETSVKEELPQVTEPEVKDNKITCTAGCPARPAEPVEPLVLTYEDEAIPLAERVGTFIPEDRFDSKPSYSAREAAVKQPVPANPTINSVPQVETRYVTAPAKTQYPITRQYPISVQYPITVQRNMTVEQPVLMQQPIVVRRPIVMQQDIMVQRQPTIVQQQPMVMQQQPSFIQGQPVFVQAPAATPNPIVWNGMNASTMPMGMVTLPQQSISLPQQTYMPTAYPTVAPQNPIQGQMPVQPMYQTMPPMYLSVPMVQPAPMALSANPQTQQPVYQN